MKQLCLGLLILSILSACTVSQEIMLRRDGSGTMDLELRISDFVIAYAEDIYGSFVSDTDRFSLFDTLAVEQYFSTNPSAEVTALDNPDPGSLSLSLRFSDSETILDQTVPGLEPVIEMSTHGGVTTCTFTLTPDNMRILTDPVSLTDSELLQVFGPQSVQPYTTEEYIDLLTYAFEEYLEEENLEDVLSSAVITVTVRTDGEITNVRGGVTRSGEAIFRIPFMDIVTMSKPVQFSISWK